MIAVIVPAHNEEALIGDCLNSVTVAARCPALSGEEVRVFVALDRCSDRTANIASEAGAVCIALQQGNVGAARAAAASAALHVGARWLACTDADTRVPTDWLSAQVNSGGDAFCGIVDVDDWGDYDVSIIAAFRGTHSPRDGHLHIHGANLGISSTWYRRCGGFATLSAHEDVALVQALVDAGASIARRASPVVLTSGRRHGRAPVGFSTYLHQLEASLGRSVVGG